MNPERHVLVVFPHPDDEAFGVSGTISMHIANDTHVTYACLTLGEMGRNLGNPPFATRESLPGIRKKELKKAADAMGIKDLRMMGLRDKTIEFEDDEKMVRLMTGLLDELKPSLVISFYPGYSVHPDHEATGRAVVRAIERLPKNAQPKLHCVAFSKGHQEKIGLPDIVHNVEPYSSQKIAAIKAHISQTAWLLEDMEEKWLNKDEEALKWLNFERFWTYPLQSS